MKYNIEIFEENAQEYDEWFNKNRFVYESEVVALKQLLPVGRKGLEIGVGTGRFAAALGIKMGIEPAEAMADIARSRGLTVCAALAEKLPFRDSSFDLVLIVVTICFVENPIEILKEAKRVLTPNGHVVVGIVDKESFLGKEYEMKKRTSKYYAHARFYSTEEILNWLKQIGFYNIRTCQTIFKDCDKITSIEPVKAGYGKGGFVVISAQKIPDCSE